MSILPMQKNEYDSPELSDTSFLSKNKVIFLNSNQNQSILQSKEKRKFEGLRNILIKLKKNKIRDAFLQKAMRNIDSDDEHMKKEWKREQQFQMPSIEGFITNQKFQHTIEVLNIFCFAVLLIVTSFIGFLDDFALNYSNDIAIMMVKLFCLVVIIMRVLVKLTSVTFSEGEFKKYLSQIIIAYYNTSRLVFDSILLLLQILNFVLPQNMVIAAILFYYLNLMLIYPGNDTIRTQAAYIQNKKTNLIWILLKIICFNLFFAHFMATTLLAMAKMEPERSWMVRAGIEGQAWFIKYIYAYYWGTTIMMTVGFGDILPGQGNWKQIFMTSLIELFSCIVLGYNISSIGNIVSKIRDSDEKVNRKVVVFQRMMRRDRNKNVFINPYLEKRISNYLQQLRMDKSNMFHMQKDQLLQELPENLRRAYFKQANKRIFSSVNFFSQLKPKTLQILAEKFRSKSFNLGETLPYENNILILEDGRVGLTYKKKGASKNGKVQDQIVVSQYEKTVLLNSNTLLEFMQQIKYGMIARTDSIVWSIPKQTFIQVISQSCIDFQYYFSLLHKHSVLISQWEFIICERCSHLDKTEDKKQISNKDKADNYLYKAYHTRFNCSRLTYMPIRSLIISRNLSVANSKENDRMEGFVRYKSTLSKKNIFEWKAQFTDNIGKVQKSFSISISKSKITSLHKNNKSSFYNSPKSSRNIKGSSVHIDYVQEDEEDLELKLKRIIKEVMFEFETGYEQDFWYLKTDEAHDYQFYFPQDNPNRLHYVPINIHPRQASRHDQDKLTSKIKSIAHMRAAQTQNH